jgi:hypothetical protein
MSESQPNENAVAAASATRPKAFAPWVWIPLLLTLGGFGVYLAAGYGLQLPGLPFAGLILYLSGLFYFLVQMCGRLILKQWRAGFFALARLVICASALVPAFVVSLALAFMGPSEDNFAKNLTIPTDIEIAEPLPEPERRRNSDDSFQVALLSTLARPAGSNAVITPSCPSLVVLARDHQALLLRYLASSAAWRVFEEDGALFATRRWKVGSMWLWNLHGYYTSHDVESFNQDTLPFFQSRTTIGLNGKTWVRLPHGATWLDEGNKPQPVSLNRDNQADQSYCIIRCGGVVLELFEQSHGHERRLTDAALAPLELEFKALLARKEFDRTLVPEGSITNGKPVLSLYIGLQPGIYEVEAWVNPGEPGTVYLKAFEVTHNTRLSEGRLYDSSNERVGWSENTDELFRSNTRVTIYEGDWGQPYAARFELWFKPESGSTERKLLERNFKIEGWQR